MTDSLEQRVSVESAWVLQCIQGSKCLAVRQPNAQGRTELARCTRHLCRTYLQEFPRTEEPVVVKMAYRTLWKSYAHYLDTHPKLSR